MCEVLLWVAGVVFLVPFLAFLWIVQCKVGTVPLRFGEDKNVHDAVYGDDGDGGKRTPA